MLTNFVRVAGCVALGAAMFVASGDRANAQMADPEQQFMSLGTSSVGGTWYPLGGAMAAIISRAYPALQITAEVTGGTNDNLNLMKNGQVELAYATNAEAFKAYNGEDPFDEKIQNFSGLLSGHGIYWQLYALKNSGIESIADLKGKRISLGAAGSIGNDIGQTIIEAHGLKMGEDWTPEYIGHGDGPGALRDGNIDAALIISSFPTAAVTDITSTEGENVVFINPDPEVLDELIAERPYWARVAIPGGLYKGHAEDQPGSFGVITIMVANNDLSDEAAYAITKALLENHEDLADTHALGADWNKENAARGIEGVIPFHPGAEAYLKEQGLL
ncbi:TAXI family TRAP transporter solute-binding subunit [Acuticoccus sp. M5D2P5]|uniref:TAXI family TRAP transporter solute-binding subunit n=1 Tax=Acuticoccus kalidii TaxID=2910977 RepID=UPI001F3A7CB7|nr:TAXI family TRAP transporter solute-binding subunit [Acuticoccus kalidii]MCF3933855.1 TAXI family TRAP transporter solute-binding subunit [Acuticoccus kalidii]